MIFEYKQIEIHPNIQHAIYNGKVVGIGSSSAHFVASLNFQERKYNITTDSDGRILIKGNDIVVGEIKQELKNISFRSNINSKIPCFDFKVNEKKFVVYHITFLKKNHNFYQIEENNKIVGMIQKDDKVVNYNHKYFCYSDSNEMFQYMALWCLFLQSSKYYTFMTSGEGNVVRRRLSCSKKHIRDMYDPSFIQRVKMNDGVMD